jgi:hypothetical protein
MIFEGEMPDASLTITYLLAAFTDYRYPPHSFRGTCYCIFSDSSYLDVVLLRFDSDG